MHAPQSRNLDEEHYGRKQLAILGGPRRHFHGHRRARARRRPGHPQAAVGKPRALPRCGRGGHPPPAGAAARRAGHARPRGMREDGHHGGHQRPAGAQGRAHAAGDHAGLPRCVAHRLPAPAAPVRPAHRVARAALQPRHRGPGARGCAWRGRTAAGRGAPARAPLGGVRRGAAQRGHRVHARMALHRARSRGGTARARGGLHAGEHLAWHQPVDEVRQPRRHHRGGRLPFAHPAALRGAGRGRDAGRAPLLHAIVRRAGGCAALPGQGRDPLGPRRRHRGHGPNGRGGRLRPGDRVRHGGAPPPT